MNYSDAKKFCEESYGGQLIDGEHENVLSRVANDSYWSRGDCMELVPFESVKRGDCGKENPFVCVKPKGK